MIDFSKDLNHFDGTPFLGREVEGKNAPMRLGDFCAFALQFRDQSQRVSLGEIVRRDDLTRRVFGAGETDLAADDVTLIIRCVEAWSAVAPIPTSVIASAVEMIDPVAFKRMASAS